MPRSGTTPKVRARPGVSVALAIVLISAGADVSSGRPSLAWAAIGNTTRALITIATSHTRAPLKCTPLPRRNRAIVVAAFAESSGLRAKDAAEHQKESPAAAVIARSANVDDPEHSLVFEPHGAVDDGP